MRALNATFFALFFALTLLPEAAKYGKFAPKAHLYGAVVPPAQVPLGARSYFDGTFQQAFEQTFDASFGVRGALIRADNELNFKVFAEFAPRLRTILGKNYFLYDQGFIDDYNRRNLVPASELEQKVRRLKLLQDFLQARQSTLLLMISPSKPLLYPEFLPKRFVDERRAALPNNYSVFVRLLREYGVNVFDSQQELTDLKATSPIRFFADSGMHWDSPASCRATSEMSNFIAVTLNAPIPELRCDPPITQPTPSGTDRDLADLANLWDEDVLLRPTPYTAGRVVAPHSARRPSVLFVGSSFVWNVLSFVNRRHLHEHDSFFYYYNTRHDYPEGTSVPIDRTHLDWQNDIFARQAIVFEVNASVVDEVGWGFLEDAERAITALDHAPK